MSKIDQYSEEGESLFKGYSGRIFITIALGMLVANLGRQLLPPLLPAIIESLAITPAAAGFALTLMRICYAVFQYPSGRVADTISRKGAIVIGLGGMVAGFTVLTQARSYLLLLLSTGIVGVGFAFFFVSERVLLSDIFVNKRGRAFGVNSAVSRIGSILAAGLGVIILTIGPWQLAFIPIAILVIVTLVLFHIVSREEYHFHSLVSIRSDTNQVRNTIGRVFGTAQVRWLVVSYTLVMFAWDGIVSFLPIFLRFSKGFSPELASGGFAILFATGIVVQPLFGTMSDRLDRRTLAGIATLISSIGLMIILVTQFTALIIFGIILYATGAMAFTPVLQAYLMDIFPEASKGGDLGAFKTIYEGFSSLGPTYVGVVASFLSYTFAFVGFLLCLCISAIILAWLSYTD